MLTTRVALTLMPICRHRIGRLVDLQRLREEWLPKVTKRPQAQGLVPDGPLLAALFLPCGDYNRYLHAPGQPLHNLGLFFFSNELVDCMLMSQRYRGNNPTPWEYYVWLYYGMEMESGRPFSCSPHTAFPADLQRNYLARLVGAGFWCGAPACVHALRSALRPLVNRGGGGGTRAGHPCMPPRLPPHPLSPQPPARASARPFPMHSSLRSQ